MQNIESSQQCQLSVASEQVGPVAKSVAAHPTHGRKRKVKRPLSNLPHLPLSAFQHRLDTSSEEAEEERVFGQEPKRLRSTWKTPRNAPARAWAPHEYDNIMGIGSVSSPSESEKETDSERADRGERSAVDKPLKGSIQSTWNLSGAGESSRDMAAHVLRRYLVFYKRSLKSLLPALLTNL